MPAHKKDDPKDAVISFRLPQREKDIIDEKAKRDGGIPTSDFLRRAALGRQIFSSTDMTTIRELRRLGGLQKLSLAELGDIRRALVNANEYNVAGVSEAIAACNRSIEAVRAAIERVAEGAGNKADC
jgi:hypothetical protein